MKKIIIGCALILIGLYTGMHMKDSTKTEIRLENFDDLWGALGYPEPVEKKMKELLPQAEALADKSIYLQMLSQIALAQALQQKFDEAHATLNTAHTLLTPNYPLARARIFLERGRTYQQEGKLTDALTHFKQSYEISKQNNLDAPAVNAAHMIAIVVDTVEDKITWNELALNLAQQSTDIQAKKWIAPITNNLGQNYLEAKQYDKALPIFEKALVLFRSNGYAPSIRMGQWTIAHTLRMLGRTEESLELLQTLVKEYDSLFLAGNFDCPKEIITLTRGWVYEDLAEIYSELDREKARSFATLALADLKNSPMFQGPAEKKRLERLQHINQ